MAVISFWNSDVEESGKSSAIIAIATFLGVNYNYKTLVMDTKFNDYFYQDCFWQEDKTIKQINSNDFKTDIGHGVDGLAKAVLSNKISPEIITNYTRIVFNQNRLELLMDSEVRREEYEKHKSVFKDIALMAGRYYDLVFLDIDNTLDKDISDKLLEISDLVVACIPQKLRSINNFQKAKQEKLVFSEKQVIPLLGRYDNDSKYNVKNVARYLREKRGVCAIPFNTLFSEACGEARVADYFIKYRNIKDGYDKNAIFISSVKDSAEKIIERLRQLQMRM